MSSNSGIISVTYWSTAIIQTRFINAQTHTYVHTQHALIDFLRLFAFLHACLKGEDALCACHDANGPFVSANVSIIVKQHCVLV